jgi:uncharacterized membrane protein YphA (DoxX/SURF4 family)
VNVLLWVLQILLALAFLAAGLTKLSQPREKLRSTMGWVDDYSANSVRGIGALELLAGLGLVLPAWTGIAPVLTPLAAVGLEIIMVGATIVHARRKEFPVIAFNVLLIILLAVIIWGRFGSYSY